MLNNVSTILRPPVFPEDEDKTRKARYANFIALIFLGVTLAYEAFLRIFGNYVRLSILDAALFVVAAISITGLVLLRKGRVQLASILLVALTWAASNGLAAAGFGIKDSSYIINFAIILMAGLLLSWPAAVIVTVLSAASGFALAYAEQNGLISVPDYAVTSFARDLMVVFVLNGALIFLLISGLENALKRSRMSLRALETANSSLSYTQSELQIRTNELTISNEELENRTQKLHAIAMVTRTAASIQNFDLLLTSITGTISKELGYYHVGLFLVDEHREYAILRSTNTVGGTRMLNRGYRVPVGQLNPVGFVAQIGQPRIVRFDNEELEALRHPDLPDTRSEIVLPLKSGDKIIGVLDIQSQEVNTFAESDISTLSFAARRRASWNKRAFSIANAARSATACTRLMSSSCHSLDGSLDSICRMPITSPRSLTGTATVARFSLEPFGCFVTTSPCCAAATISWLCNEFSSISIRPT